MNNVNKELLLAWLWHFICHFKISREKQIWILKATWNFIATSMSISIIPNLIFLRLIENKITDFYNFVLNFDSKTKKQKSYPFCWTRLQLVLHSKPYNLQLLPSMIESINPSISLNSSFIWNCERIIRSTIPNT